MPSRLILGREACLANGLMFVLAGGFLIPIAPPQRAVFDDPFSDYLLKVILVLAFSLTLGIITGLLRALQSGRHSPLRADKTSV